MFWVLLCIYFPPYIPQKRVYQNDPYDKELGYLLFQAKTQCLKITAPLKIPFKKWKIIVQNIIHTYIFICYTYLYVLIWGHIFICTRKSQCVVRALKRNYELQAHQRCQPLHYQCHRQYKSLSLPLFCVGIALNILKHAYIRTFFWHYAFN